MTSPDALYLRHMLDAIDRVIEATQRVSVEEFHRDWVIQDAIVHELQILGKAAGRVSRTLTEERPEIPWRKVTGLRHKIVHDYFVLDLVHCLGHRHHRSSRDPPHCRITPSRDRRTDVADRRHIL